MTADELLNLLLQVQAAVNAVRDRDILNEEIDYIAEGERLLQQQRTAVQPAAQPSALQPPPPQAAAPAAPTAPTAPAPPASMAPGVRHAITHLHSRATQRTAGPASWLSEEHAGVSRLPVLQSAAGPSAARKPPAAPSARPKPDPAPFGKSGVSISKNLGRQTPGALSDEVHTAAHPDSWRTQAHKAREMSLPTLCTLESAAPLQLKMVSSRLQQLRALRADVYAPQHEDGSLPLPGNWGSSSSQVQINTPHNDVQLIFVENAETLVHKHSPSRALQCSQCMKRRRGADCAYWS